MFGVADFVFNKVQLRVSARPVCTFSTLSPLFVRCLPFRQYKPTTPHRHPNPFLALLEHYILRLLSFKRHAFGMSRGTKVYSDEDSRKGPF